MNIREAILEVFRQIGREPRPDGKGSLVDQGILDSLSILDLISGLEQRFDIALEDEMLTLDRFESISSIEQLVRATLDLAKPGS